MAILRLNYIQRHGKGKGGKTKVWQGGKHASTRAAIRAAGYYRFREGPDLERRSWYDAESQRTHEEVIQELKEHAHEYDYVYRTMMSTRDVPLSIDDYRQVAAAHFERVYILEHRNTDHPHAHVIGLRNRVVKDEEREEMYKKIRELEQQRELGREQGRDQDLEREQGRGAVAQFDELLEATRYFQRAGPMTELEQIVQGFGRDQLQHEREHDFFVELEQYAPSVRQDGPQPGMEVQQEQKQETSREQSRSHGPELELGF